MSKNKARRPGSPATSGNGVSQPAEAVRFVIPSKRICIAIPSYTGALSHATLNALLAASTAAHQQGWTTDLVTREADSCIQRARCFLLTHFLERTDCTDLLFLDADIGFTAEGFVRLMSFPVDVVAGAYRARGPQEHYILRPLENELQRKPPHGLMEVEGVGAGFLRITRAALIRMVAAYPDDWYTDPTCANMVVRDLFSFTVEDHHLFSEDYNFCRKWRAIGGQVWVDPEQALDHVGFSTFRGCLMRWLEAQMPRIPAGVAQGGAADWMKDEIAKGAQPPSLLESAKALVAGAQR
jgi:hypothetical protein